jgi:hypothetical protein
MLKAGMKPIQVESKLAEMDPVLRPLLSQIQGLNKTLKKVYPNMDTLHAAMVALAPFIANPQGDGSPHVRQAQRVHVRDGARDLEAGRLAQ